MKPLTLALTGLEQEDITDFRRVFGKLRSQLEADWRLVDGPDADLTVIDIDSIYGHMDWLKLTGSGMRTAVYTSAQYAKESDLVLFKPLKAENLAEILNAAATERAGGELESAASAAAAADADVTPVAVASNSSPRADRHELATGPARQEKDSTAAPAPAPAATPREVPAVKQAKSESHAEDTQDLPPPSTESTRPETVRAWLLSGPLDRSVRLSVADDTWVVDADRETYYGPAKLKLLGDALDQPIESLKDVDVTELEKARKGSAQPLSRLRWYAGLTSSPGNLNPALRAGESYKLARWPQIEREFPRHFRIATAMMKQAGSVAELAAASGAPEADVADFINASHAIGIVESPGVAYDAPHSAQLGGVMSRLRSSLGR
ncbi:MAG: hypothetical protein WCD66_09620 [Rhodanobacteraceae bacterium]